MSERHILYLNINGFLGGQNKKTVYKSNIDKAKKEIKNKRENTAPEKWVESKLAKKINSINSEKGWDMIFLSEVNPQSEATEIFINQMKKYVILAPSDKYGELNKIPGSSCTICLKKQGLDNYTNENNGFNPSNGDYLHFCKIVSENNKEVTVLIGIHWAVGSDKQTKELDVSRTADFILSLKRLLTFTLGKKVNVILFGDTNANPDVDLEKAVEEKETTKIEAYINNCIFEHLMNELGLHEIVPEGKPYTFKGETRIDRVFTNMPKDKVKVEVDQEFLKKDKDKDSLSDHAALVITYEEV